MAKRKRGPGKQKPRVVVNDLQVKKSGPKGGSAQFNPKEFTIEETVTWKKSG